MLRAATLHKLPSEAQLILSIFTYVVVLHQFTHCKQTQPHIWLSYFKLSPTLKSMKLQESLLTQTTKQSLIQMPITDLTRQETVKVFMHHQNRTFSITLPLLSKTIQSLIREALENFNELYSLKLTISPQEYAIYAARRNGNKCRDYPSLDDKQNILLTNIKLYCLTKKNQHPKEFIPPLSYINLEVQKKTEKKVKKNPACFCIF